MQYHPACYHVFYTSPQERQAEARKHDVQGPVCLPTAFRAVVIGVNDETLGPSWKRGLQLSAEDCSVRGSV